MRYNIICNVPSIFCLEIIYVPRPVLYYLTPEDFAAYEAGESLLSMSKRFGISRETIARQIKDRGIILRSQSQSAVLRAEHEGVEGRQRLSESAHQARRGQKDSEETKLLRAKLTEKKGSGTRPGTGEKELINALREKGIDTFRRFMQP